MKNRLFVFALAVFVLISIAGCRCSPNPPQNNTPVQTQPYPNIGGQVQVPPASPQQQVPPPPASFELTGLWRLNFSDGVIRTMRLQRTGVRVTGNLQPNFIISGETDPQAVSGGFIGGAVHNNDSRMIAFQIQPNGINCRGEVYLIGTFNGERVNP
jgi:hypothetical protein